MWLFSLSVDTGHMLQRQLCHHNTNTFLFVSFPFFAVLSHRCCVGYHFVVLRGVCFSSFKSNDLQGLQTRLTGICNTIVDCIFQMDQELLN
jgi:hypothetical protein